VKLVTELKKCDLFSGGGGQDFLGLWRDCLMKVRIIKLIQQKVKFAGQSMVH